MIVNIVNFIKRFTKQLFGKPLNYSLRDLLGFYPIDKRYYEAAFTHNSCTYVNTDGRIINNERLEFLGDSVLATVISAYLYKVYPDWSEGQMSKRRGALVKRAVNNVVAEKMNLGLFIKKRNDITSINNDILGNTLEALIGAIYLDRGYSKAEEFIVTKLIPLFKSMEEELITVTTNYKSILMEWIQKHHYTIQFNMLQESRKPGGLFICQIWIDDKPIAKGKGYTKKESHQEAAHRAINRLNHKYKDLFIKRDN